MFEELDHFSYDVEGRHYYGRKCTVIHMVAICDRKTMQIKVIKDKKGIGKIHETCYMDGTNHVSKVKHK